MGRAKLLIKEEKNSCSASGNGQPAHTAAQQPDYGIQRRKALQPGDKAADKEQDAYPQLCQQGDAGDGEKLGQIQTGNGDQGGQQRIAVAVENFPGATGRRSTLQSAAHRKIRIKQGGLRPQTVPADAHDIRILYIVEAPHDCTDDGQDKEYTPDKGAFQLH